MPQIAVWAYEFTQPIAGVFTMSNTQETRATFKVSPQVGKVQGIAGRGTFDAAPWSIVDGVAVVHDLPAWTSDKAASPTPSGLLDISVDPNDGAPGGVITWAYKEGGVVKFAGMKQVANCVVAVVPT